MSKKYKKVSTTLNYIEHFLILASKITGCISISAFASLLAIPIGIANSAIRLKIFAIVAEIRKYRRNLNYRKLNSIEVLISKTLINSIISHDEVVLINNGLKEYDKIKEEIKNLKI